jgi:uncharacterized protein DUF222
MCAAGRSEAQAAAARLDAIGELFELRRAECGKHEDWAVDTWAAVGAEVASAFQTSLAMAGSYLRYALAMRERLPQVAAVFRAGDIDYRLFQTIVYRTDLTTDVARADRDAVRCYREGVSDREVSIRESDAGMAELQGRLFGTGATALDKRLDALATVCATDPRTHDQRRADALGALPPGPIGWVASAAAPTVLPVGVARARWSFR